MIFPECLGQHSRRSWRVSTGVGNPEAAAKVELDQLNTGLSSEIGVQPEGTPRRDLESSASKICEPIWEWMPISSSHGCWWQPRSADSAVPPAIEKPNF